MAASYDLDREPHNNKATDFGRYIPNPQPTNTSHHAIAEFIWPSVYSRLKPDYGAGGYCRLPVKCR